MTQHPFHDRELEKLLALASQPVPRPGARERLLAAAAAESAQPSNVVAFRPRQGRPERAARPALAWLTALPLAASLAAGIWLGAVGVGTQYLPESLGGGPVTVADDAIYSGVDEAETLTEDSQV